MSPRLVADDSRGTVSALLALLIGSSCQRVGFDYFLSKPFDPNVLADLLGR